MITGLSEPRMLYPGHPHSTITGKVGDHRHRPGHTQLPFRYQEALVPRRALRGGAGRRYL